MSNAAVSYSQAIKTARELVDDLDPHLACTQTHVKGMTDLLASMFPNHLDFEARTSEVFFIITTPETNTVGYDDESLALHAGQLIRTYAQKKRESLSLILLRISNPKHCRPVMDYLLERQPPMSKIRSRALEQAKVLIEQEQYATPTDRDAVSRLWLAAIDKATEDLKEEIL